MPVFNVSTLVIIQANGNGSQLTSKSLALRSSDIREDDMALSLGLAVTAAPVKLAEVVDGEAGDLHGAAAVVLQDLVLGAEGSTAGDGGGVAGLLLLDGEGVLADGGPPDVGQLAGAHAVHAFDLVGADDDVGEGGAGLSDFVSFCFVGWMVGGVAVTKRLESEIYSPQE